MSEEHTSPTNYVRRIVNFERCDYELVKQVARKRGLGRRGFSAAVRMILREWAGLHPLAAPFPLDPPGPQLPCDPGSGL